MRVLIVKTSALGDVVHTFGVAQYFQDQGCVVDWVVEKASAELVQRHPAVSKVIVCDTKSWRSFKQIQSIRCFFSNLRCKEYDIVLDLQGNTKSMWITLLARGQRKVGYSYHAVSEWPNLLATSEKLEPKGQGVRQRYLSMAAQSLKVSHLPSSQPVQLLLDEQQIKEVVGVQKCIQGSIIVCPCTRWPNKMLPENVWISFLQKLDEKIFLCWGNEMERMLCEKIQRQVPHAKLLKKMSLAVLQNVMKKARCVISVDSLPLHLAASIGVPTFSIFTASSAKEYAPDNNFFVQAHCPYDVQFTRRCPALRRCKTGACREQISVDDLFQNWCNTNYNK